MISIQPFNKEQFTSTFDFFNNDQELFRFCYTKTGSRFFAEALLVACHNEIFKSLGRQSFFAMSRYDQFQYIGTIAKEFNMNPTLTPEDPQTSTFTGDPNGFIFIEIRFDDLDRLARIAVIFRDRGATYQDIFKEIKANCDHGLVSEEVASRYRNLDVEGIRRLLETELCGIISPLIQEAPNEPCS